MKSVRDILKGHMKEIVNDNQELYEKRLVICRECPLFKMTMSGAICNSLLYLNTDLDIAFAKDGPDRVQGCGCRIGAKARLEDATCPASKW